MQFLIAYVELVHEEAPRRILPQSSDIYDSIESYTLFSNL